MINLYGVVVVYDASVIQFFVDFILAKSMFDVVVFYLVAPAIVE